MPRATRYLQDGFIYHLTHRCHDGRFFLRFSRERDQYREWLRIGAQRYHVAVLGWTITSNHTHVVVDVDDCHSVASMMKLASGVVAQARHRRKGGEDSMWEHPYQSEGRPEREAWWIEAVAIGSEDFVDEAVQTGTYRRSMEKQPIGIDGQASAWLAREPSAAYKSISDEKSVV